MSRTRHSRLVSRHASLVYLSCMLLVTGAWNAVQAAPSQKALLSRASGKTDPNIFYTIDDSGSMAFSHAPDDVWAGMSNQRYPIFHPNDNLSHRPSFVPGSYAIRNTCVVRTDMSTGLNASNLRLRSSQFNRIYYNPAVRYRPWAKANPLDPDFGNASYTAARVDPRYILNSSDPDASPNTVNLSITSPVPTAPNVGGTGPKGWCTIDNSSGTAPSSFNPAVYFRFNLNPATATTTQLNTVSNYTMVNLNGTEAAFLADTVASTKGARRTDCVSRADGKCSLAEERQNFANWFTYYRTRSLLARGATSLAFSKLHDPFRLGYGRINFSGSSVDGISGAPAQTLVRGVRDFSIDTANRSNFFSWLYTVPYNGGTPLRRAMDDVGRYFQLSSSKGPWGKTPGSGSEATATHLSCRKSYHIFMTDGYWNGDAASSTVNGTNWDGSNGPAEIADNRDGRTYRYSASATDGIAATSPYKDDKAGTLADVAQYYWMTDLRTDIKNNLSVEMQESNPKKPYYNAAKGIDRLDHAFWQHLTTFTVGLGINGTRDSSLGAPPSGGWPAPVADGQTAVDDLWHAAVNGRGKYLSAGNPQEFQDALDETLNEIFASQTAPSGVSVSAFVISSDSKKYVPSFSQPQWVGELTAYDLSSGSSGGVIWKASQQLPAAASRAIYIWNGSAAVPFDTSLSATLRAASLWGLASNASDDLIKFLRGDRSLEGGGGYRCRGDMPGTLECNKPAAGDENKGLLGDIVNSMPTLVKGNIDMSYEFLPAAAPGRSNYRAFVADKKKRSIGVLFAGANDGMLHAFDDKTGKEVFAFIPQAVIGNLARLANPNYGGTVDETATNAHRYFVDGPLAESDAYINGNWANVLLGTTGAGGKSVFALQIDKTTPTNMSASSVLWEINTTAANSFTEKNKLGYITSPIAVGRMMNGQWAAVFGNGLDSTDGKAYLMVVDLATGSVIRTLQAGSATGNGLGGVTLVRNSERTIVAAYAGDAKGNVWRFDLESASPGSWQVGLAGSPLYAGSSSQPISAAPTFLPHPRGGLMVLFGTGQLYASGDETSTATQTLYGVWDTTIVGKPSTDTVSVVGTTSLVQQTVSSSLVSSSTGKYYQVSQNGVNWTGASAKRGWYLNLTLASGQRNIFNPFILSGLAFFNTIAPTTPNDDCDPVSSLGYTFIIDPLTGAMPKFATFDINGDGWINSSDLSVGALVVEGDGRMVPTIKKRDKGPDDEEEQPCSNGSPLQLVTTGNSPAMCTARQYTQRYWRQIQNFPR